jgi:small subunit ribosomal protein S1
MIDHTDEFPSAPGQHPDAMHEEDGQAALMDQLEDMQSLMDAQEAGGFRSLRRRQTTKGVVVSVREDAVLVDVGAKSEGIIPREELAEAGEEIPELTYGQEILVQVLEPDSRDGPVLSLRRARREQAWVDLEVLGRENAIITAVVVDHNRGGAILDVRGLRGFVPLSQLSSLPPPSQSEGGDDTQQRLAQIHGQRLTVKVLEADQTQNRLILSERAAGDELRAQRRAELLTQIEPGQIRKGTVRSVTTFGAFVDLGGAEGLVHVSELSYDRVKDPRSVVKTGDEVEVYVLEIRPEDSRISLSMKRAMLDPWSMLSQRYQPGEVVEVTITRLMNFGAFAQVEPGIEGLIHISELSDVSPKDPSQVVQSGQTVQAKIIHIDQHDRKLGLSMRQVNPTPGERQMTTQEWHAEQERQSDSLPSAFEALSQLRQPDSSATEVVGSEREESTPIAESVEPSAETAQTTEAIVESAEVSDDSVEAVLETTTPAHEDAAGDAETEAKPAPKRVRQSRKKATITEEPAIDVADAVSS